MAHGPAVSWEGVREISRAPPRSDWAGPIKKVLRQVHPDISRMDADALLLVCDLIDYCLHRVARRAEELASGAKFRTAVGELGAHRVLAHRILPRDEFLIVWDEDEAWDEDDVSWESREDALSAGIDLAAFEQKPAQEVDAEFERFAKDFESQHGEPFAPGALDSRCIQGAVRHFLPGELAKHAINEGTKALQKATSGWSNSRTDSRTKLAGLCFPVDIVGGMLASICGRVVREGAAVYLTGSLEYLCAEVLEVAGNAARDMRATAVHVRHIFVAIENDEALRALMGSGLCLMGGGVMPDVRDELRQALTEKDLAQWEADDEIDGVMFVTGVSLATGKRLKGSAERDRRKLRNSGRQELVPVAHWSDQQMNELGIFKFRDPPRPRSLPQGVQPLPSFLCPITLDLMKDPVSTSDGCVTPPVPVLALVNISRVLFNMLVYADSAKKAVILWTLSDMER